MEQGKVVLRTALKPKTFRSRRSHEIFQHIFDISLVLEKEGFHMKINYEKENPSFLYLYDPQGISPVFNAWRKEQLHCQLKEIVDFPGALYSSQPLLLESFMKSYEKQAKSHWVSPQAVKETLKNSVHLPFNHENFMKWKNHHICGDSHSVALWTPDTHVYQMIGKTLFSFARTNRFSFHSLCLGNIDVNHHLSSKEKLENLKSLVLKNIPKETNFYSLLPALKDNHDLRKCYWHSQNQKFGVKSYDLRCEMREKLMCFLQDNFNVLEYPTFKRFEPRTPHIHPESYYDTATLPLL